MLIAQTVSGKQTNRKKSRIEMKLLNILVATLGLTVPVLAGLEIDRIQVGIIASLGGLALCNEGIKDTFHEQLSSIVLALTIGILAFILGTYLSGNRLVSLILIPIIIFIVATIGRINRTMVRASILFILFIIIATSFESKGKTQFYVIIFFALGAFWTALLSLIAGFMANKFMKKSSMLDLNPKVPPKYTFKQLLNHWRKYLHHFEGWQFSLRITSCIIIAETIKYLWPHHHGYWILLTIAIVVQPNIDNLLKRMNKRAIGTIIGIIISMIFIYFIPPVSVIVLIIAILAALRSILKEKNYLAYSVVMTPLVIILLDFGNLSSFNIVLDRLYCTLIGCGISFIFGYYLWIKCLNLSKR